MRHAEVTQEVRDQLEILLCKEVCRRQEGAQRAARAELSNLVERAKPVALAGQKSRAGAPHITSRDRQLWANFVARDHGVISAV